MADAVTTPVAAAAASATGALASGLPPTLVMVCAAIGAIISVWASESDQFDFTAKWALSVLGKVLLYAATGILGATFVVTAGPEYPVLQHLAKVPMWALAGAMSLAAVFLLPWMRQVWESKVGAGKKANTDGTA